jgi:hypothetical protein
MQTLDPLEGTSFFRPQMTLSSAALSRVHDEVLLSLGATKVCSSYPMRMVLRGRASIAVFRAMT